MKKEIPNLVKKNIIMLSGNYPVFDIFAQFIGIAQIFISACIESNFDYLILLNSRSGKMIFE